jgi:hypothetical protein
MAGLQESVKRVAITKANTQVVVTVSVASFIAVFCLLSSYALWGQNAYLAKVISKQQKAHVQLQANLKAAATLSEAYAKFTASNPNAVGGDPNGTGDKDGDNAKIVLDALPSSYDFPALASSLEKLLNSHGLVVTSISGTDDQIAQQTAAASPNPQVVPMAFSFSINNASYDSIKDLVNTLQLSIRPIQIDTMALAGDASSMQVSITAHTFYQPPKAVNITSEVVQ